MKRFLELASLLTNHWSLAGEVCEDMDISHTRLKKIAIKAREHGLDIEREDGKIRLGFGTTVDNVKFAISMDRP